jgi:hypothetical protein
MMYPIMERRKMREFFATLRMAIHFGLIVISQSLFTIF